MKTKKIRLQDIEFDLRLINMTIIAHDAKFSHTYVRRLLYGEKKNEKALWKLRNSIVKQYGSVIKLIALENNILNIKTV